MEQLRASGFVGPDDLSFVEVPGAGFFLVGEVACKGRIVVSVEKFLTLLEGEGVAAMVQTEWYSYNAFVRGWHNILRYDNQHPHELYPGHLDEHHRHTFDWQTGEERSDSPAWIGAEKWPTLSEAIREVQAWYWDHRQELPDPEEFPELGAKG